MIAAVGFDSAECRRLCVLRALAGTSDVTDAKTIFSLCKEAYGASAFSIGLPSTIQTSRQAVTSGLAVLSPLILHAERQLRGGRVQQSQEGKKKEEEETKKQRKKKKERHFGKLPSCPAACSIREHYMCVLHSNMVERAQRRIVIPMCLACHDQRLSCAVR